MSSKLSLFKTQTTPISAPVGSMFLNSEEQVMVFNGSQWVNVTASSDKEPKVSSQFMSDEDMMEEIRIVLRQNVKNIRNLPVEQSSCIKICRILTNGMDFPEVTVEIAQNFDGEGYFVFKYKGKDLFGDTV